MSVSIRRLRIFLSSPGDVGLERTLALKVFDQLSYDPLLRSKVSLEAVAWDKPGSDAPLLATMTPQEAINLSLPRPSECDVVVVILWKRLGTPLPFPEYQKPNGERYLSGTEWEFWDAVQAAGKGMRPQVVVYRRKAMEALDPDDQEYNEKAEQYRRVQNFFASFTNPDGSIIRGFNAYEGTDDFRVKPETHLRFILERLLSEPEDEPEATTAEPEKRPLWQGSPFPGLRPFFPPDQPIFHGRGQEVDKLVDRLKNTSVLVVSGPSGSGKSSLVGAGLIPALSANAIDGSKDWLLPSVAAQKDAEGHFVWQALYCRPNESDPFLSAARAFLPLLSPDEWDQARLVQGLAQEDRATTMDAMLATLLKGRPSWSEVLLFVDQFEELFTRAGESTRAPFLEFVHAFSLHPRARVVLSMRADFDHWLQVAPRFADLVSENTLLIGMPTAGSLIQMIVRPAERAGITFEDGLVERLLDDFTDAAGSLPLLALTLDALSERSAEDRHIRQTTLDALGGVRGVVNRRAEAVLNQLGPDASQRILPVFARLTAVRNGVFTRQTAPYKEFESDLSARRLVDALVDARLLVRGTSPSGETTVEVAHDVLLNEWPMLTHYLTERREFLIWREGIERDVRRWRDAKQDANALARGRSLLIARSWQRDHRDELADDANRYIDSSWRQRQIRRALAFLAASIVIFIVSTLASREINQAFLRWQADAPMTRYDNIPPGAAVDAAFRLDRYEVSNARYSLCMDAGACGYPLSQIDPHDSRYARYPVVSVTAADAERFCTWLGRRLPTVGEWAYATFGEPPDFWRSATPDPSLVNLMFDDGSGSGSLQTVDDEAYLAGSRNEVMHLVGNAAEWTGSVCEDSNFSDTFEPEECQATWNPETESAVDLAVVGLSYQDRPQDLGLNNISTASPYLGAIPYIGFRCALSGG